MTATQEERDWVLERFAIDAEMGGRQIFVPRGQQPRFKASGERFGLELKIVYRLQRTGLVRVVPYELEGNICRQKTIGKPMKIADLRALVDGDDPAWVQAGTADTHYDAQQSHSTWSSRANGMAKAFRVSDEIAQSIKAAAEIPGLTAEQTSDVPSHSLLS